MYKRQLDAFYGTGRRFEKKGTYHGVPVIDDYAHHPTEIAATLAAARDILAPGGKIFAVFQPHTYSRASSFLEDFTKVLKKADTVIVTEIYSAREKDPGTISGASMTQHFQENGVPAKYIPDFSEIADYLKSCVKPGDLIITLRAGDVNRVIEKIVS